jgi:threonine dehydrogenase-like Zn-dependent dehydrogenase
VKAVVFHGIGDIRLDTVKEPNLKEPNDAIVRLTASAICGTDLHMIRGTMPGMKSGTILGHEGVGVIEEFGKGVRNFKPGERVVIPSTIGCGYCSYCRAGYFAQCDHANPNGPSAGTAFFGGPRRPAHSMDFRLSSLACPLPMSGSYVFRKKSPTTKPSSSATSFPPATWAQS